MHLLLLASLLGLLPQVDPQPASPAAAQRVLRQVQGTYRTTDRLTARFQQRSINKTFGASNRAGRDVSDGKVYLRRTGKMRWDYYSKRNKNEITRSKLSDGKTLWAVNVPGKWFFRQRLADSALPAAVTFLSGKGDLTRDFRAILLPTSPEARPGYHVLQLTPKKPSAQIKTLVLVVNSSTFRVVKSIVTNAAGDTNEYSFSRQDTKAPIKDQWFVFNPKAAKGFRQIKPTAAP